VATVWIVSTDVILFEAEEVGLRTELLSIGKGLLFVALTSFVLFRVLRRAESRLAREAELRGHVEVRLAQGTKLEALGRFASTVAHDFNNILAAIVGIVDTAPAATRELTDVRSAAERGMALTRQLADFGRPGPTTDEPIDVAGALLELEPLLQSLLGSAIGLELRTEGAWANVDKTQLEMGVVNLAANARDAMPSGGTVSISCRMVADAAGAPPFARIEVADTGFGIEDHLLRHVFDPYVTTKETGSGLGLFGIHSYVTKIGGSIRVASIVGEGATFTIDLPAHGPAPVSAVPPPAAPSVATATIGTVLVVDDDEVVVAIAARVLRAAGYQTTEARSAGEALQVIEASGPVDVLVTDIRLPGLGGDALARRVLEDGNARAVVVMSGAGDEHAVLPPTASFVAKPFTPETLVAAVAEATLAD
jgi:signal transduction histidine kinase